MTAWGTPVEVERRNRIRASLAALQYELRPLDAPYMSDHEFDALCLQINPDMDTGHPLCDKFFANDFSPDTGQWIRSHPELEKLDRLHYRLKMYKQEDEEDPLS